MGTYDIAQICLNGHVINNQAREYREHNKKFCPSCGSSTITTCPFCNTPIKGYYSVQGVISLGERYRPPHFCEECGRAYPWTVSRQKAAEELIEFSDLAQTEKEDLKNSVTDLVAGGPKSSIAILKVKKYIGKAGTLLGNTLKDILTDVLSEAVKKAIWG